MTTTIKSMEIHSKIITSKAREMLKPLGLKQKGASRSWLDDHGWWVLCVEFQPHKSEKGTFLNVGACWLWDPKDYFSYDFALGAHARINEFIPFKDEAQFQKAIDQLMIQTIADVSQYREKCNSVSHVADLLEAKPDKTIWDYFHAGMANGLAGHIDRATAHFHELQKDSWDYDWLKQLKERVKTLLVLLENQQEFRDFATKMVTETRSKQKLNPWEGQLLQ